MLSSGGGAERRFIGGVMKSSGEREDNAKGTGLFCGKTQRGEEELQNISQNFTFKDKFLTQ